MADTRAKQFGFKINYHFMIGFPEETRSTVKETLRLIYKLTRNPTTNVYGPAPYIPYPGTPLFQRSVEMGFIPPSYLEGWIHYDWSNISKFPWFSNGFKRYLKKIQFIASKASTPSCGIIRRFFRLYFRIRLFGTAYLIDLPGVDIAIFNSLTLLRNLFKPSTKR